jgi:hypothetical protein
MTSLTFVPLSLVRDGAWSGHRAASVSSPIIFGREAVFIDAPEATSEGARRLPLRTQELGAGNILAAVVQKGRLFERAHPEVTVLRNRGRFLLVELPPDHPILVERMEEPCYAAYRVEPGTEVFRDLGPADLRFQPNPVVGTVLDGLSVATFRAALEELVALRTRLSTSDLYVQAADMCRSRFESLGYQVNLQEFDMPGGRSSNVLAVPKGARPVTVLVTAHLDSVNHAGGPDADAPGADDNGSGSAGVIAMAEALVAARDQLAVGFVLFGGEEQGLIGSRHMLESLPSEARAALQAVVNMDMIGTLNIQPDGSAVMPGVLLEGAEVSRGVIEGLVTQAATWTDLAVQTSFNPFASDHVPFIEAGLPAVLTIEGADQANEEIHGPGDTLDRINDELAYRILRMNTAYVASLTGT